MLVEPTIALGQSRVIANRPATRVSRQLVQLAFEASRHNYWEDGMTEGDKAFYKRRLREELQQARAEEHPNLRLLHERWAKLYQDRLDGVPRAKLVFPPARMVNRAGPSAHETYPFDDLPRAA